MADKNSNYPVISAKNWWTLREKFKSSLPSSVSESYVMTLLGMANDNSARSNVITPLRRIGLIDQDNKPTELAKEWRLDESYKNACEKMIKRIYPDEFLDLFSGEDVSTDSIVTWFMRLGVGKAAAMKMASFYLLIKTGEIHDAKGSHASSNNSRKKDKVQKKLPIKGEIKTDSIGAEIGNEKKEEAISKGTIKHPSIHIDLQIHISPESTPEQIECIFSNMAKHLCGVMD